MGAGRFEAARPGEIGPAVTPNDVRPPFPGGAGPNSGSEAEDAEGAIPEAGDAEDEGPKDEGPEGGSSEGGSSEGEDPEAEDPGGNPAGRAAPPWAAATRGPNQVEAVVPGVGLDWGTGSCTGGRR
jgi:hypothetical protein